MSLVKFVDRGQDHDDEYGFVLLVKYVNRRLDHYDECGGVLLVNMLITFRITMINMVLCY